MFNPIRKLIINTGDISDIDGFFALAEYAKTGAAVLFIMNFPAYFNVSNKVSEHINQFGLGYTYSMNSILQSTKQRFSSEKAYEVYRVLLKKFDFSDDGTQNITLPYKKMYTLLALTMCHEICPHALKYQTTSKEGLCISVLGVSMMLIHFTQRR